MRTARLLLVTSCLIAGAALAKLPDFPQSTRVAGKVPPDFSGAWFMYAQAEFPGGKTRALQPQLITVSPKGKGEVALRILDVQLPKSIDEPYKAANRAPTAWEPKPEDIALLRKEWSKLPPATTKDWRQSEVIYGSVEFTLASPDKYAEVFAGQAPGIQEALKDSVFALEVVEKYRPHTLAPGETVAQVMERKSVYVVNRASDSVFEGKQFTGYVAAGPGVPIPMSFTGPFRLYRLAKGSAPTAKAPARTGKAASK